jgi:hypothetical protein
VIGVVSDDARAKVAVAAGADATVPAQGLRTAVSELVGERGVDVVVDPVGGDRFTDSLRCLGIDGRLLVIGFTAGEIPTVKVNRLLLTNTDVVGVGWTKLLTLPGFLAGQWADLGPHLRSGALRPVVSATSGSNGRPRRWSCSRPARRPEKSCSTWPALPRSRIDMALPGHVTAAIPRVSGPRAGGGGPPRRRDRGGQSGPVSDADTWPPLGRDLRGLTRWLP